MPSKTRACKGNMYEKKKIIKSTARANRCMNFFKQVRGERCNAMSLFQWAVCEFVTRMVRKGKEKHSPNKTGYADQLHEFCEQAQCMTLHRYKPVSAGSMRICEANGTQEKKKSTAIKEQPVPINGSA